MPKNTFPRLMARLSLNQLIQVLLHDVITGYLNKWYCFDNYVYKFFLINILFYADFENVYNLFLATTCSFWVIKIMYWIHQYKKN